MKKDELLAVLKSLADVEEHAVLIYTKHLESTFFLSNFQPAIQKDIKEMLLTLALESEVHGRIFDSMMQKIKESAQDVY